MLVTARQSAGAGNAVRTLELVLAFTTIPQLQEWRGLVLWPQVDSAATTPTCRAALKSKSHLPMWMRSLQPARVGSLLDGPASFTKFKLLQRSECRKVQTVIRGGCVVCLVSASTCRPIRPNCAQSSTNIASCHSVYMCNLNIQSFMVPQSPNCSCN
jgi:hypothetical protein